MWKYHLLIDEDVFFCKWNTFTYPINNFNLFMANILNRTALRHLHDVKTVCPRNWDLLGRERSRLLSNIDIHFHMAYEYEWCFVTKTVERGREGESLSCLALVANKSAKSVPLVKIRPSSSQTLTSKKSPSLFIYISWCKKYSFKQTKNQFSTKNVFAVLMQNFTFIVPLLENF